MSQERFEGKQIPTSPFADDTGAAKPWVSDALASLKAGHLTREQVLLQLIGTRLFVPVTAVLDSTDVLDSGVAVEKDSHMATVSMQARDGRRRLLGFTSTDELSRWDTDSRPIAVYFQQMCQAAQHDSADGIVINPSTCGLVMSSHEVSLGAENRLGLVLIAQTDVSARVVAALRPISQTHEVTFELEQAKSPERVARIVVVGRESVVAIAARQAAEVLALDPGLLTAIPCGLEIGGRVAG